MKAKPAKSDLPQRTKKEFDCLGFQQIDADIFKATEKLKDYLIPESNSSKVFYGKNSRKRNAVKEKEKNIMIFPLSLIE